MTAVQLQYLHGFPRLGEILLKHTSLTQEQLQKALEIQEREGGAGRDSRAQEFYSSA